MSNLQGAAKGSALQGVGWAAMQEHTQDPSALRGAGLATDHSGRAGLATHAAG